MSIDFVRKIKEAELQAEQIVQSAERDAKSKIEHTNRELTKQLEIVRSKADQRLRTAKTDTETKSVQDLEQSMANLALPEISYEEKSRVADQVLEGIVELLGNS
ncbi:MAG TPA: hypothetical protein GXZ43_06150 [Clostridiaceae bacterium]|nr:hypothetical protein [Clostridiaceae bacterium]